MTATNPRPPASPQPEAAEPVAWLPQIARVHLASGGKTATAAAKKQHETDWPVYTAPQPTPQAAEASLVDHESANVSDNVVCGRCVGDKVALQAAEASDERIAGALFDFLGFLTTSEEQWKFSAYDDASPAVLALEQWAAKRRFALEPCDVSGWHAALPTTVEADAAKGEK